MRKLPATLLLAVLAIAAGGGASASAAQARGPDVIPMIGPVSMDTDLRLLPQGPGPTTTPPRLSRHAWSGLFTAGPDFAPPVLSRSTSLPAPSLTFAGINSAGSGCGCLPPDTNGDVGPSNYVQAVNSVFQIWNKSGTSQSGPTSFNTLFSALGPTTPCGLNEN